MAASVQDVIMLFGDSITQQSFMPGGLAQQLASTYIRKLDIINRGFSGYNTTWAIPIFKQIFAQQHEQQHVPKVRLLTIWFGANDACVPPSPQHVPLPQFASQLTQFITFLTSTNSPYYSPSTKIVLFTPPPVNTLQRGAELRARDPPQELDRTFDTTRAYAEAVKDVGAKYKTGVLDVWTLLWDAAGQVEADLSKYLSDGLHLNEAGYQLVYNAFITLVKTDYPELDPSKMSEVFIGWSDVIALDPTKLEEGLQKRIV